MSSSRTVSSPFRPSSLANLARTGLGCLAVAAALALSSPGVRIARADDAAMSIDPVLANAAAKAEAPAPPVSERQAPSCSNPGPGSLMDDAMLQYQTELLLRQMVKRAAAAAPPQTDAEGEQGIVLNSRGYNYPSGSVRQ